MADVADPIVRPGQMTVKQAAEYARVDNMVHIADRRDAVAQRRQDPSTQIALRNYAVRNGFVPLPEDCRRFRHEVMLLAFTGPGHARPCNPDVGVILMGAFGTDAESPDMALRTARQFATSTIAPNFPGADIRAVPMDKWTPLAATPQLAADEAHCVAHMDANMEAYYSLLQGNQAKFKRRVEDSVKALEQQEREAARVLQDAQEALQTARREDTPNRAAKLAGLQATLTKWRGTEGLAFKEACHKLRKRVKRLKRTQEALETRLRAAETDLDVRRASDAGEEGRYWRYPVPPEDAEELEERVTELGSRLDDMRKALAKDTEELETKAAERTETENALQSQINTLATLDVAAAERQLKLAEERHAAIRERALKAAVHDKVEAAATDRLTKAAREAKLEEERIATLGLPVDADKKKKVSARLEAQRQRVAAANADKQVLAPFPSHLLPRRQSCAAVCFLPDCTGKGDSVGEPMVRILKTYETKEEAERDVQDNLCKFIVDFDIDVVDMGEWLFPAAVDYDRIEKFQFRDVQQQEIMQSRRREKKRVRDYDTLCAQEGLPATELFLKEAEEGISMEEYHRQTQIQGTVEQF